MEKVSLAGDLVIPSLFSCRISGLPKYWARDCFLEYKFAQYKTRNFLNIKRYTFSELLLLHNIMITTISLQQNSTTYFNFKGLIQDLSFIRNVPLLLYKGPGCKVWAAPDTLEYPFNRGVLVLHFTIQGEVQHFMFHWFNLFQFTKFYKVNKSRRVSLIWFESLDFHPFQTPFQRIGPLGPFFL